MNRPTPIIRLLTFLVLLLSSNVLYAQLNLGAISSTSHSFIADDSTLQAMDDLRTDIVQNTDRYVSLIKPMVHPSQREKIDLSLVVSDIVSWTIPIMGCSANGSIVGFYSPLDFTWVFIELDEAREVKSATLSRGFSSDDNVLWWPYLYSNENGIEDIPTAIRADVAFQLTAFAHEFSDDKCPSLGQANHSGSNLAIDQLVAIEQDTPRATADLSEMFLEDLKTSSGTDLEGARMRYQLPLLGDSLIAAFISPEYPGTILLGRWQVRDDGYAYHKDSAVVPLILESRI